MGGKDTLAVSGGAAETGAGDASVVTALAGGGLSLSPCVGTGAGSSAGVCGVGTAMALSLAVATSTGVAGAAAGVEGCAGAALGSVATRVRGLGVATGGGVTVGAGVGGTHRVCIGATRTGSAVCSRHSSVPVRPKIRAMCTTSTAPTSHSGARRDGSTDPVEPALALERVVTRAPCSAAAPAQIGRQLLRKMAQALRHRPVPCGVERG